MSDKYVKHAILKKFIMTFIRPHVTDVITNQIPEEELKKVLWECHEEIDELKNQMDVIKEIKSSVTDKVITEKLMKLPKYKELGEMLL